MRKYLDPYEVALILNISEAQVLKLVEHEVLYYSEGSGISGESISEYIKEQGNQKKILSRRKFLKNTLSFVVPGILGFTAGAASNFAGSLGASLVHDNLLADSLKKDNEVKSNLASSIFGNLAEASWSTNLDHLLNTYGLSDYRLSSTYMATSSIVSSIFKNESDLIPTPKFPGPVFIDGDIVCIGSPISDPIARAIFEYKGPRYEQTRDKDAVLDLPFLYLPSELSGKGKRFICGEQKDIQNWTIADNGNILQPPSFDKQGFLKTDYLLISRVPNILSEESYKSGRSILIIGGVHGTGTEAIKLILNDKNLLLKIAENRKSHNFFQSLFYVNDIEHRSINGKKSSIPINALHVETLPITLDAEKISRKLSFESNKFS